MGDRTGISWTESTWNPVSGCSAVSPGCARCYAEAISARHHWTEQPWTAKHAAENVVLHPDRLDQPLHWRRSRRIFVCSMGDLFHEQVPDHFIDEVFEVMRQARHHTFQVLTKRPQRMAAWCWSTNARSDDIVRACPHVWLGVSAEDQRRADARIPILLQMPVAMRFVSLEPLLGPIDLGLLGTMARDISPRYALTHERLHWVIVGGESGPGYREMRLEWLESLVAQCRSAHVPVFVKQDSGPRAGQQGRIPEALWALKAWPA